MGSKKISQQEMVQKVPSTYTLLDQPQPAAALVMNLDAVSKLTVLQQIYFALLAQSSGEWFEQFATES
ncbi:MAG: hypothetical protein M1835_000294 [Candelina submexicana]|nr:MAG: hypothetical protein M1835_000294 [Candelina submexicana]